MKNGINNVLFMAGKRLVSHACLVKNGFRDRLTILKASYGPVPGLALFVIGLVFFAGMLAAAVLTAGKSLLLANAPAVRFKTDGLDADKVKFIEDLNKRFELVDVMDKAAVDLNVRQAVADHFKDIDLNQIKEMLGDDPKSIRSILKMHGATLTELKNRGGAPEDLSIRGQIATWMETNKEAIKDVKTRRALPALHIRAAVSMLESTQFSSNPTPIVQPYLPRPGLQPGIVDLIRVMPTFWDYLTKGATKLNPYIWVNKHNAQGAATFTAEGALKPLGSFELETENSTPKKITERMKVSTELLSDIDGMTSEVQNELIYQVKTAANAGSLTGTGVGVNPKGITLYAAPYTLASITGVIAPNNADAVRAAIAQLRVLNFNGALTAFMNPADVATMDLEKSLQGQYVLPPFTTPNGRIIAATPVVEDNNIAQGYLLIGDMSKYRVLMYEDFFLAWGWENDDFTKNLTTVIGEMRFHQFVSDNHTAGFIYDTFANIKAAIA